MLFDIAQTKQMLTTDIFLESQPISFVDKVDKLKISLFIPDFLVRTCMSKIRYMEILSLYLA